MCLICALKQQVTTFNYLGNKAYIIVNTLHVDRFNEIKFQFLMKFYRDFCCAKFIIHFSWFVRCQKCVEVFWARVFLSVLLHKRNRTLNRSNKNVRQWIGLGVERWKMKRIRVNWKRRVARIKARKKSDRDTKHTMWLLVSQRPNTHPLTWLQSNVILILCRFVVHIQTA